MNTDVLPDLLAAILQEHGLTLQKAIEFSRPDHEVDRAGKLRLREDFPRETKETIRRLREAGFRWPPQE